jgi:uncharacterized protein
MPIKLDASVARRIAMGAASGFPPRFPAGRKGVLQALRDIGYVQIDTINVLERAHNHVFFTRVKGYERDSIASLELGKREIFEYWAHAAAYLPIEEYRYCLPRMSRVRRDGHDWFKVEEATTKGVLDRIRAEGPLESKDFEDPRGRSGTWWDWKPAKRALERLFQAGEILVRTRNNFRKVFDLSERVLPAGLDTRFPDEKEMASHLVDRAAKAYGIFTKDEAAYQRRDGVSRIGEEISERLESGALQELTIDGVSGKKYFAKPEDIERAGKAGRRIKHAYLLSPFDPFIIDRRRIERLFGFSYWIECYLPAEKRKFGYFAIPLIYGDSFAGLMDIKVARAQKTLQIPRLRISFPPRSRESFSFALLEEVSRLAAFVGADAVRSGLIETDDSGYSESLRVALSSLRP